LAFYVVAPADEDGGAFVVFRADNGCPGAAGTAGFKNIRHGLIFPVV